MVIPVSFNPPHGVTLIRANAQRRVKTLAEFLLNPRLCPLRLHIEVHCQQEDDYRTDKRTNADQD